MIPTQSFWPPLWWGLAVLASWVGWGRMLGRWWLGRDHRPELGLCAGWGLCAMLVVGGILNALRICSPALLIAVVAAGLPGLVLFGRDAVRRIHDHPEGVLLASLAVLPLLLWGAIVLAGSLSWNISEVNPADDLANYLMYPVKMLQTGAAIEPFSLRRLSTFGGFAFLQAVMAIVGNEKNAFLLDVGLGSMVLFLLLAGAIQRRHGPLWALYLAAAACWLYEMPRVNTMVAWIGTATALTLARTFALRVEEDDAARRARFLIPLAAGAAACCSLRANYLPLPLLFLAAGLTWDGWRRRPRRVSKDLLTCVAWFAVMLLPWSLALYQAGGSLLYPLMKGNHRGAFFSYAEPLSLMLRLKDAVARTFSPALLRLMPGMLMLPFVGAWPALWLSLAAILTTATTMFAFPNSDLAALSRYTIPLLIAGSLLGIVELACARRGGRSSPIAWAGILSLLVLLGGARGFGLPGVVRQWRFAIVAWSDREPPFQPPLYQIFAEMQRSIPRGSTVASVVDYPSLWDFRRNRIYSLDFPGVAVRHRAMPFFQGPEALRRYLADEGFDCLAYNDFGRARGMYDRAWYASLVGSSVRPMNRVAEHTLDFMDNVDALARTRPLFFDAAGMRVIRIR